MAPLKSAAQETKTTGGVRVDAQRDTLSTVNRISPLPRAETARDTVRPDTIQKVANQLTDIVKYQAEDYMRLSRKENRMYLYDQAQITYEDMVITAGMIVLDNEKNEVYAYGIPDSTGAYSQLPVFTQGLSTIQPDSIRFNFDTQKALVYNARTEEGAFKVRAEVSKKENDSVFFMKNVKFTTSSNELDPDYYFFARKIKFVPDKKIVTGLVNMYIADVPTPLGLPFGYFPLTEEQTSGFVIPTWGQDNNRGYFLQNGGYYFAINDYVDLLAVGDYYTNGSYGLRLESNYAARYRFRGNLSFRFENLLESERGFPDFAQRTIFNMRWTHTQDAKANPNTRFSASVNLGSSEYFQQSVNQSNTANFLNNTLNSSVSYSKTFPGEPQANINIVATHNQNTRTEEINMTLPTVQGSITRVFPFAPKVGAKKGFIENINFQYNMRGENRIKTTDSLFLKPEMFDNIDAGVQHSIPVATNFKVMKFISVSSSANYQENWVFRTFDRFFDETTRRVVIDTVNGFDSFRTYNFSTSAGTTLYGLVNFGSDKKFQSIRHVMRPSVSFNVNPGFDQFFDSFEVPSEADPSVTRTVEFSRFQGTLFGAPSRMFASTIGLGIQNSLEAKVRDKDTSATAPKKIVLLNNLGITTSYNIAADSVRLSPINIRGSIPVVPNKLDLNFGANLDIYALDNNNRRVDRLNINNGGSLFRLTAANANFSYSISSRDFEVGEKEKDKLENPTFRNGGRPDDLFGKAQDLDGKLYDEDAFAAGKEERLKSSWYNYKIPWNFRMAYTVTFNNNARQNEITSHSIMFSGSMELSPKWIVGGSSGYDIKNGGITYTTLNFQRDLDSWRMSFNWVPFGDRTSWYFFIGIKSGVLSDIKYDKRREPDRRL